MSHLSRRLNFAALFGLRVLSALRPRHLILYGLAGAALTLVIANANWISKAIATACVGLTLLGLLCEWSGRRPRPRRPAVLSARIIKGEPNDD